jgi:hypothetical protein
MVALVIGVLVIGAVTALAVRGFTTLAVDEGERITGEPALLGVSVEQHLDADDIGVHALRGVEGRVTITVTAIDADFDPVLRVLDLDGNLVGENDDADGTDSRLTLTLAGTDDLRLEVHEFSGDPGDYALLVQRGDGTAGSSPVDGGRIGIRTDLAGTVGRNQAVAYLFTGEGREVVITVRGEDGFDPVVRVIDGNGIELGRNDDADGLDSRLEVTVPGASTVTVEVTGFAGRPGSYVLRVE